MGVVSAVSAPMPAAEGEPQSLGLVEINLAGEGGGGLEQAEGYEHEGKGETLHGNSPGWAFDVHAGQGFTTRRLSPT